MINKKVAGIFVTVSVLFLSVCVSNSQDVSNKTTVSDSQTVFDPDELDKAIRRTSDYLNSNIPHGNKLAILNFQSEYSALSEYVIDELIANTVNDKIFTVVDRANLALIQQETEFQSSGNVSDEAAVSIGKKLGAQTIVSGSVSQIGNLYRLRVRALDVQTAQIQGQFNYNIADSPTIAILVKSTAAGYGRQSAIVETANQSVTVDSGNTVATVAAETDKTARVRSDMIYKVGAKGPAGGYIFFDKGNNRGGWQYLEAAPEDTERVLPFGERIRGRGPFGRKAGDGKENSESHMAYIQENGGGINTAVWYCDELVVNGYNDWYLPTTDELMYIYNNLFSKDTGGFKKMRYWSSMFNSDGELWIDFNNGEEDGMFFGGGRRELQVRAVRRF
jgi:TolB-like protein